MSLIAKALKQKQSAGSRRVAPPGMLNLMPKRGMTTRMKVLLSLFGLLLAMVGGLWGYLLFGMEKPDQTLTARQRMQQQAQMSQQQAAAPAENVTATADNATVPLAAPATVTPLQPVQQVAAAPQQPMTKQTIDELLTVLKDRSVEMSAQKTAASTPPPAPLAQMAPPPSPASVPGLTNGSVSQSGTGQGAVTPPQTPAASVQLTPEERAKLAKADGRITENGVIAMAESAFMKGDYTRAKDLYEDVAPRRNDSSITGNLLYLYIITGEKQKAASFFASRRDTLSEPSAANIVQELAVRGRVADGNYWYSQFEPLDRSGRIFASGGFLAEAAGDLKSSQLRYAKGYSRDGDSPEMTFSYARALDLNRDYAAALPLYRKVVTLGGSPALVRNANSRAQELEPFVKD